jgi:hypothetical protein
MSNAQLVQYVGSRRGALFQYREMFVGHTKIFLDPVTDHE